MTMGGMSAYNIIDVLDEEEDVIESRLQQFNEEVKDSGIEDDSTNFEQ